MSPPDDQPAFDAPELFDIDTDEGLEAYLLDLHRRHPLPESLRYPETDEAWDRMIAESDADPRAIPWERVKAWMESWGTDNELPRPEPE